MGSHPVTDRTSYRRPTTVILCLVLCLLPLTGGGIAGAGSRGMGTGTGAGAGTNGADGPAAVLADAAQRPPAAAGPRAARAYAALPLAFEPNRGQAGPRARYLARGRGYTLALTDTGAVLSFASPSPRACRSALALERATGATRRAHALVRADLPRSVPCHDPSKSSGAHARGAGPTLRLTFLGAASRPALAPENRLPGTTSYLRGRDPRRWLTGLPTYARVAYQGIYPGAGVTFYGRNGRLEYDLTLAPGADPARARLRLDGARSLTLGLRGDLIVSLPNVNGATGALALRAPVAYQTVAGARRPVAARFVLLGAGVVGLRLGHYDHRAPLVVDPALDYSTYLGGNGDDQGLGVAVDRAGAAYVVGYTSSTNFPSASAVRGAFSGGAADAFVSKLNPSGTGLVYSTYLGGGGDDFGLAIAASPSGAAYVTGSTDSGDFPLANPAQGGYNSLAGTGFVAELNPSGTGLVYSTYLGGTLFDYGTGIAVDPSGAAYVTGVTASGDFPMASPLQGSLNGSTNAFVTKLTPAGNGLVYSTYLGGGGDVDQGNAIAVDPSGAAYVTGATNSRDFPLANALQPAYLGTIENAFVSKINPAGAALVYSTYLGGGGDDVGLGIAADAAGAAYVTGQTSSTNFPTTNALQAKPGSATDAFVSKLTPNGAALAYSTYLGGGGADAGNAVAVDINGNAVVAGQTSSTDFPTVNPAQGAPGGGDDAFVASLNAAGNSLNYSTYLGGGAADSARGVALDIVGNAYVAGSTASPNLPTARPIQGSFNGGSTDAFVARIGSVPIPAVPPTAIPTGTTGPTGTPAPPTPTAAAAAAPAATATIARTATVTASATITPSATITGTPVAPGATPTRSAPRPPFSTCSTTNRLPLSIAVGSRGIAMTGDRLAFTVRTTPATRITATLQVTAQRTFYAGTGKKRKTFTHTVVVYDAATGGASDKGGAFTGRLHVTYKPASPVRATLSVTAFQSCGRANRAAAVTIEQRPPALSASAAGAVRIDRILTVTLRTARGAKTAATLQVTARRTVTIGKGKSAKRAMRTIVLYSVGAHGTADKRGTYTARLHVTYKTKKPAAARVTATSTLYGVTATRTLSVTIHP